MDDNQYGGMDKSGKPTIGRCNMITQCLKAQSLCIATLVLLVSLSGCGGPIGTTPIFFSATPLPVTHTPMPSLMPPTRTRLPTLTPEVPTPTMAPTLSPNQEEALILDLLQNNAGCRLPCWWGFTPGKTSWQTAQAFFASLGKKTDGFGGPYVTIYEVELRIHDTQISQTYIVINGIIDMIWVGAGVVRDDKAVFGDPLFAQDWQRYMLPQLLITYGRPREILIRTFQEAPEGGWVPFHLLLFYQQQGILVDYQGPNERSGEQLRWCPQKTNIALWLWSPERELTLQDVAQMGPNLPLEEVRNYRSLEEATNMSLDRFYEVFKRSDNQACLETPAELWP